MQTHSILSHRAPGQAKSTPCSLEIYIYRWWAIKNRRMVNKSQKRSQDAGRAKSSWERCTQQSPENGWHFVALPAGRCPLHSCSLEAAGWEPDVHSYPGCLDSWGLNELIHTHMFYKSAQDLVLHGHPGFWKSELCHFPFTKVLHQYLFVSTERIWGGKRQEANTT